MTARKKDDRGKSAISNSPHGRKLKEGTAAGQEGKQKINIWSEWSENDVNNEKWEISASKGKEKDKAKSPQQFLFEDPDGGVLLPASLNPVTWKRISDVYTKNPVVVDPDRGVHDFDLFTPNEHLFGCETLRWMICQISTLWSISEKIYQKDTTDASVIDPNFVSANGKYHAWRFWDHIFSINKVGKGLPQFNPSGKYVVKLYWMGEWRKIYVDDLLPYDQNDKLLLPVSGLENEIWPIILSKALLKVASLSYCSASNEPEFGDFSVIHCLTGWIPQKKIVSKEYQYQLWSQLSDVLHKWSYSEQTKTVKDDQNISPEHVIPEASPDKSDAKDSGGKEKNSKKDSKDKSKEKKEKSKSSLIADDTTGIMNQNTLVMATYKSNYSKLNCLTASKMADYSESLRKMGLAQSYSHPVLLNFIRDIPLIKPATPEPVPAWKLIRPLPKNPDIITRSRSRNQDKSMTPATTEEEEEGDNKPLQKIEIQTPFLDYRVTNDNFPRSYSNLGRSQVTDIDEDFNDAVVEETNEEQDVYPENGTSKDPDIAKVSTANTRKEKQSVSSTRLGESGLDDVEVTGQSSNNQVVPMEEVIHDASNTKEKKKRWINMEEFCNCFETIYIYHRPEAFSNNEQIVEKHGVLFDQKDPLYIFTDNSEPTEILFGVSYFSHWLPTVSTGIGTATSNYQESIAPQPSAHLPASSRQIDDEIESSFQYAPQSCVLIAEHFSWKNLKVGNCYKRMRTNAVKAISLQLPPGRHCLRIHIQQRQQYQQSAVSTSKSSSEFGYACRVMSQQPFVVGNEDKVVQQCTDELHRIKVLGTRLITAYRNLMDNFFDWQKRCESERMLLDVVLGEERTEVHYRRCMPMYTQIMSRALLKLIERVNPDILNKDILLSFRCLTMNLDTKQILVSTSAAKSASTTSNRNSAKAPISTSKGDGAKSSGGGKNVPAEVKADDKKSEFESKEYTELETSAVITLQKHLRGWYVKKVMQIRYPPQSQSSATFPDATPLSRQEDPAEQQQQQPITTPLSTNHQQNQNSSLENRITSDLQKISTAILGNATAAAETNGVLLWQFVEEEISLKSKNSSNGKLSLDLIHGLVQDRANHISLIEFSGKAASVAGSGGGMGRTLLFRDTFYVTSSDPPQAMVVKLNCQPKNVRCTVQIIDNDSCMIVYSDRITKRLFIDNLIGNVNGYTLLGYANEDDVTVNWKLKIICDGRHSPPKFNSTDINSDFSVAKVKDYYIPRGNGQLFQQMINVKENHPVSVIVKLSNPKIPLLVTITNHNEEMCLLKDVGEIFIPLFVFPKYQNLEETSVDDSNRSPSRGSNKSKRKSAKASRVNSSNSNSESTGNKFSIQAFVDVDKWNLTDQEREFIDSLKTSRKNDMGEQKAWSETNTKSGITATDSKKDVGQKSQGKTKGKEKAQEGKNIKGGADKGGKGGAAGGVGGDASSRPGSSTFDEEKPNWKLFILSDVNLEENIKIHSNNEKYDQLVKFKKSLKDADPQRLEKGKQAQLQFLEELGVLTTTAETNDAQPIVQDSVSQQQQQQQQQQQRSPSRPKSGGSNIQDQTDAIGKSASLELPAFDLTQYHVPQQFAEGQLQALPNDQDRVKSVELFRQMKKDWELWCQQEKVARKQRISDNYVKYKEMQKFVDINRLNYYRARETFRKQINSQSVSG